MGWRVTLSDQADQDLEHVVAFLAKKDAAAGLRLGMELVAKIFSLTKLPRRVCRSAAAPDIAVSSKSLAISSSIGRMSRDTGLRSFESGMRGRIPRDSDFHEPRSSAASE